MLFVPAASLRHPSVIAYQDLPTAGHAQARGSAGSSALYWILRDRLERAGSTNVHGYTVDAAALRLVAALLNSCRGQPPNAPLLAHCASPLTVVPYPRLIDPSNPAKAREIVTSDYAELVRACVRLGYQPNATSRVAVDKHGTLVSPLRGPLAPYSVAPPLSLLLLRSIQLLASPTDVEQRYSLAQLYFSLSIGPAVRPISLTQKFEPHKFTLLHVILRLLPDVMAPRAKQAADQRFASLSVGQQEKKSKEEQLEQLLAPEAQLLMSVTHAIAVGAPDLTTELDSRFGLDPPRLAAAEQEEIERKLRGAEGEAKIRQGRLVVQKKAIWLVAKLLLDRVVSKLIEASQFTSSDRDVAGMQQPHRDIGAIHSAVDALLQPSITIDELFARLEATVSHLPPTAGATAATASPVPSSSPLTSPSAASWPPLSITDLPDAGWFDGYDVWELASTESAMLAVLDPSVNPRLRIDVVDHLAVLI